MSEMVPKQVREEFRRLLWAKADALDWPRRAALEKASLYENWAKDKEIGGVLTHYMDSRKVRVYIKDTLMKPYQRNRLHRELEAVANALGVTIPEDAVVRYTQPPGYLLSDGRLICWGNVREWKDVLFSVFERTWNDTRANAHAAALIANGKPIERELKDIADEAARRLGVNRVVWLD